MRILTWNINGVRTLNQYHPWYTLKTLEAMLESEEIKSDIFCFQEMKIARTAIDRSIALPGPYDAFFSLPLGKSKGGYSGVAVYADSRTVRPMKAEEGLSGLLQPKPSLSLEERVSRHYRQAHLLDFIPDEKGAIPSDVIELDNEGRALVLDFGLFVLINTYCPAEASENRLSFKINFHNMLRERVRILIEEEHREVIVVGDINICSQPIDHCDGRLQSKRSVWWDHPPRVWLRDWLQPTGKLVDLTRKFWPDRTGMYTCWNTLIDARTANYGTRIDYVLCTEGLIPWIMHSDILPNVHGSDHCPVFVDFFDEITLPDGKVRRLREEMKYDPTRALPRIATRNWDEFSNKQPLLSSFFGKTAITPPIDRPPSSSCDPKEQPMSQAPETTFETSHSPDSLSDAASNAVSRDTAPLPAQVVVGAPSSAPKSQRQATSQDRNKGKDAKKRPKNRQLKLSSFFGAKGAAESSTQAVPSKVKSSKSRTPSQRTPSQSTQNSTSEIEDSEDDVCWEKIIGQSGASESSKAAWSNILTRPSAPKCSGHGLPAKEFVVNKPGPTKGRHFYLCSLPVGTGYDAGHSKRLREEVNPEFRCNFFMWASDVKKRAVASQSSPSTKKQRL
ncbi:DNase I-like protein [Dacryopinax primogenitus]|uniref:DNA-(apurinic or apyrimidinic site) endonuclease n=1 Tax=Dacryopinax primogenitus (strain DJM 731) TaxID=1858805 RepID=M5GBZ0_DACPD|nr:DNase I-like protein [Dacryopinax primogenitus]EJU03597.1 DNase I-like protein [Dacryopinax primogenitus]